MAAPSLQFTIKSNGLGNVAPSTANVVAVFGCSSGGTPAVVKGPYSLTNNLITDFGYGPGPELAANLIQSGIKTLFIKVETDTAGVASAVVHSGTGTSVLTLTSSTPFDAYDAIIQPVRAGTAGTAPEPGFIASFDGGRSFTKEIRMPANHIYTGFMGQYGITLNFTAATLVVGDKYTFTTTPPTWVAADVATAIEALKASPLNAALLHVVGDCSKAAADTIVTAVNEFEGRKKFERIFLEARDIDVETEETTAEWKAAISADFATFVNDRTGVGAGGAIVPSTITKTQFRRNMAQLAIVRGGLTRVGRALNAVADGPLVPTKTGQPTSEVFFDEGLDPGLDANRFMTLTSYNGKTGYYVTNPNLMSGPTSDFDRLQFGRVMDEACVIANAYFLEYLAADLRLNALGFVIEKDLLAIESGSNEVLNDGLVATGDASAVNTICSRTDKISETKTLSVTIELQPKGYSETVAITMTFEATGQAA